MTGSAAQNNISGWFLNMNSERTVPMKGATTNKAPVRAAPRLRSARMNNWMLNP